MNRVSSMYYERLAAAVEEASGLQVSGYLPESEEYRMESRHLGLFLPGEIDRLRERSGDWQDQMEKSIAVDRVLEVAGMLPLRIENKEKEKAENESMEAESIAKFPACQEQKVTSRVRIGVCSLTKTFCFTIRKISAFWNRWCGAGLFQSTEGIKNPGQSGWALFWRRLSGELCTGAGKERGDA